MNLDDLRIASPCTMKFSEMKGDERKRFCAQCKLNVFNLSALTRAEATTLVSNAEGRLCVTFFLRPDGTVLTSDCHLGFSETFKFQFNRFERTMWWTTVAAVLSAATIASIVTLFGPRVMMLLRPSTGGAYLSSTRPSAPGKVSTKKRISSFSSDPSSH